MTKKRVSKKAIKKLEGIIKDIIKDIIKNAEKNADFDGRKTIIEKDIITLEQSQANQSQIHFKR